MLLREVELVNFRNIPELKLTPNPGLNLLVGENGQGKSNFLEALLIMAITKSLRAGKDSELIRIGEDNSLVRCTVEREIDSDARLEMLFSRTERKYIRINGSKHTRSSDILGYMNAVFFGSMDLDIVSGEPTYRRRYLNMEISQISPRYCMDISSLKKTLEQRNHLLKEMRDHPGRDYALDAWDSQLVQYGSDIISRRESILGRLNPIASNIHTYLTDGAENLEIRYLPSFPFPSGAKPEEIRCRFTDELTSKRSEEIRRGVTLIGPQRDDILFVVDGKDARLYASQGQQRTVTLSLKLAEYELINEFAGEPPIVLLDDVLSDLDDSRRNQLLNWVFGRCQSFITCTNLRSFTTEMLERADVYRVNDGDVKKINVE